MKRITLMLLIGLVAHLAYGQCGKFSDSPKSTEGLKNHSLYRELVKQKQYDEAFPFWEKAYKIAPAADGQRHYHFSDGIKIYKHFLDKTDDPAKKKEYSDIILRLYDERIVCYDEEGEVLARKASDMVYVTNSPIEEVYKTAKKSVELLGDKSAYFIVYPYASGAVEMFREKKIDVTEAREAYKTIMRIVDGNIADAAKAKYKDYNITVKQQAQAKFDEVARDLFDCNYFIEQERPKYEADPENMPEIEATLSRLAAAGCSESDAFYNKLWIKLKAHRLKVIADTKAYQDSVRYANRTDEMRGVDEEKAGNVNGAIEYYKLALEDKDFEADRRARVAMRLARIYYTKGQKSTARNYANKSLEFLPGQAEPYQMIGEMYASSGKDCGPGTGFDSQRVVWVAIDMWQKAISAEPNSDAAKKARKQINEYTQYMPSKEDCFMQSLKKGSSYRVPCWINQTTTVRWK